MKRDTVINVLLIIAGIVLAIALFGAGVLWKSGAGGNPKSFSLWPIQLEGLALASPKGIRAAALCGRKIDS